MLVGSPFRLLRLGVIAILLVANSGCIWWEKYVDTPEFSPDEKVLAYAWNRDRMTGLFRRAEFLNATTSYVSWRLTAEGARTKTLRLDYSDRYPWSAHYRVHIRFSPDSRHLAVVTRGKGMIIIHVHSGRHWTVTPEGERITSLAWSDSDTLHYAVQTVLSCEVGAVQTRAFWVGKIDQPIPSRRCLHREKQIDMTGPEEEPSLPPEWWSPDGRYVAFIPLGRDGRCHVLDTLTRKVLTSQQRRFSHDEVKGCWKHDGTAVFCLSTSPHRAVVVYPREGRTLDITDRLSALLEPEPQKVRVPVYVGWTADDRYLLISLLHRGGYLIRPDPWKQTELPKGPHYLRPHPEAGRLWRLAWGRVCVTDYHGRILGYYRGELPRNPQVVLSPRGRYFATRDTWRHAKVHLHRVQWATREQRKEAPRAQ